MFYIVTKEKAKNALIFGMTINKKNVINKEENIIPLLNKVAFENETSVLLKITDKMASSILEEVDEVFIEAEDVELVDIDTDDEYIKQGCTHLQSIVKLAAMQIKKEAKMFVNEYEKALIEAKNKKIKNAEKVAVMTAMRKLGNNAS